MTGRDLIIYILENHLEDEPVIQGNKILGFLTLDEAAVKFEVGSTTVRVWYQLGLIDGFDIGGNVFVLKNAEPRIKKPNILFP